MRPVGRPTLRQNPVSRASILDEIDVALETAMFLVRIETVRREIISAAMIATPRVQVQDSAHGVLGCLRQRTAQFAGQPPDDPDRIAGELIERDMDDPIVAASDVRDHRFDALAPVFRHLPSAGSIVLARRIRWFGVGMRQVPEKGS